MPATTDWPFLLAAVLLASAALALLHHALLAGRPKGRLRCPRCFYDLAPDYRRRPVPPWRCPECGRDIARARHLRRTRRRPVLAALGLLLLLTAAATPLAPAFRRGGWPAIMPTRLLILLLPMTRAQHDWGSNWSPIEKELEHRVRADRLSPADWRFALRNGNLIHYPRSVPAGEPIDITVFDRWWTDLYMIEVVPQGHAYPAPTDAPLDRFWPPAAEYERLLRCPPLEPGERALKLSVRITRGGRSWRTLKTDADLRKIPVWEGEVRRPIRVRGTPNDFRRPLPSPEMNAEIRDDFGFALTAWIADSDGIAGLHIGADTIAVGTARKPTPEEEALGARLASGFVVELARDGVVRARRRTTPERFRFSPSGNAFEIRFDAAHGLDPLPFPHPFPHALLHPDELPRWEVIVRGDPVAPLAFPDTDLHWDGLLRRPLADLLDEDHLAAVRSTHHEEPHD